MSEKTIKDKYLELLNALQVIANYEDAHGWCEHCSCLGMAIDMIKNPDKYQETLDYAKSLTTQTPDRSGGDVMQLE